MQRIIIGTAGHVDHGKSLLAKTLTGVDPDRLPEEKKREMTIDLGFVFFPINKETEVAIIDVPGHERFLKTMIAAAHSIRMVLFVVAADEGVMPQTVEHLDVLKLMNIEQGIIVITKVDQISEEYVAIVKEDIVKLVKDSFLENAPIFAVSNLTNQGIEELKNYLKNSCSNISPLPNVGFFRCPIDRIFAMKGFGTVIAGTVISGKLEKSETIEILPTMKQSRIRNLQVHNQPVHEVFAGQRVAFNLMDISGSEIYRGCELSVPDYLKPTQIVNARLYLLPTMQKPLHNNERVRFHKGTGEVMTRVITLDKQEINPGEEGLVQFRLEKPIVGERKERFVIRSYSPMRTIGGGRLIELYPPKKGGRFRKERVNYLLRMDRANDENVAETLIRYSEYPIASEKDLMRLVNLPIKKVSTQLQRLLNEKVVLRLKDNSIIHRNFIDKIKGKCYTSIEQFTKENPLKVYMNRGELAKVLRISNLHLLEKALTELSSEGKIDLNTKGAKIIGIDAKVSIKAQKILDTIEEFALERGLRPFKLNDVIICNLTGQDPKKVRELLNYLLTSDVIIEILKGKYLHKKKLEQAISKLTQYINKKGAIRAIECRNLLGISREATRQILDYSFNHGITIRSKGTHRLPDVKKCD